MRRDYFSNEQVRKVRFFTLIKVDLINLYNVELLIKNVSDKSFLCFGNFVAKFLLEVPLFFNFYLSI